MRQIADMTRHIVKKAKEYDHETVPGDYATLETPCPNCGGVVKENYRRYTCSGKTGDADGCGFSFGKTPAGRTFELAEVEQFLRDKRIGPLDGFRSKAGWPFTAELVLKYDEETRTGSSSSTSATTPRKPASSWTSRARSRSASARRAAAASSSWAATTSASTPCRPRSSRSPTCDFKSRKIILQQPVAARADDQAARDGQDRPAGQVRLDAHAPRRSRRSWRGTRRRARSTSSSRRRSSRARAVPRPRRRAAAPAAASRRPAGEKRRPQDEPRAKAPRAEEPKAPRKSPAPG